ncbi:trypsin-like peptidase domain-containing protein [Geothrix sp. 21YS21S-2]|uniref:trypsin-like peptidase domain-containing protein n=1 Tax=Geothrix sp. 21YS21S-2 TaxID=3068893 RepID=UPI0027BA1867|nr:trypsin-like peptidase domain-containing protein [Geothrix sp. 21YS21S-2]
MLRTALAFLVLAIRLGAQTGSPALDQAAKSVVLVQAETAPGQFQQGSGVVLDQGFVATNAHVVKNAYRIRVLKGEHSWQAEALCLAADRDLVLLSLPGLPLPPAVPIAPGALRTGLSVQALGYPGGLGVRTEPGRITALWTFRGDRLIQTDTHNRPGSSGGGLFTEDGRLAGITTFSLFRDAGVDFAVPVDWVLALIQDRSGAPGLACPLVVVDRLLVDFGDLMQQDPGNEANWSNLTRWWVRESPDSPDAWFGRGTALDQSLRREPEDAALRESALAAYRRAVTLAPGHARAWNNLGAELDTLNRFPEAHAAFRRAVEADPGYGLAWLNLGSSLVNTRAYEEAAQALEHGLQLVGDQAIAWARLGYCELSLGRLPAAMAHYRLALRYEPFRAEWWGELYRVAIRARQPEEAERALARIRDLAPEMEQDLNP